MKCRRTLLLKLRDTDRSALVSPEELVIDEIEHGTNGTNGHNGKHYEQESVSENADTLLVPLEYSEPVKDEPISEYAATAEAADMPLLAPLIFPRSVETMEEEEQEDTAVLPVFKVQSTEEELAGRPVSRNQQGIYLKRSLSKTSHRHSL